jgi:hypothetical protein
MKKKMKIWMMTVRFKILILTSLLQSFNFIFNLVTSPEDFISSISLKKIMSRRKRDNLLDNLPNFKAELLESYRDIGLEAALLYSTQSWYEFASYTIEELNSTFSKVSLHLNDFITIYEEDFDESYAIIRGFFKHKANNEKYYAFVVIDWFEDTNQKHPILRCPLYHLQAIENQRWRSIFPISAIDNFAQNVHFVHNCNLECQDHYSNSRNRIWIKNDYYFTAI